MSYTHINDELPDGINNGIAFYEDTRNNLNDIWRKMVYGDNIMYQENQINDITNSAADAGTVGVYITDGAAPGWDIYEHVLLEEFCPKIIVYRRKINYQDASSPHEFIRKVFTWSQEEGTTYKRLKGIDFEFSLSGIDGDYDTIGYAALGYENNTQHRLETITWTMPELSKYWFYQTAKPVGSDDVMQVFSDIKKNISALRDLQVFGGVVGWDNNYAQGEYQPVLPFVPGWDMSCTLSGFAGQSTTLIKLISQETGEVVGATYDWNTTNIDAIYKINHYYSTDNINFINTHNVTINYVYNTDRFITYTSHEILTAGYNHYDPTKPTDDEGAPIITTIRNNMTALLHCKLFGSGMGHTWVSDDSHYVETFPMITNVPNWQLQGMGYANTPNEINMVNYRHKTNTTWELNRQLYYPTKRCHYYYTELGIEANDNTKIAESKYSLLSTITLQKLYARGGLRDDAYSQMYDNSTWILYSNTWIDEEAPPGPNLHIVANDQQDSLLWQYHNKCNPEYNANAITTELISIVGVNNLKIVISGGGSNTRGNWLTKNVADNCLSGASLAKSGASYIERGVTPGFQSDATHIMICYTFEYTNEILEVYNND